MSQHVAFKTKNGEAGGELALPAPGAKAPGLVVIQEYWGVNDHVRSLVDRFAHEGFVTLAPDLYHGKIARDANEAGALMKALDWGAALEEIAGAVAFLADHVHTNGHVGVTGFCMGGALALAAATRVPKLGAVVAFYGVPPDSMADYSKVSAPILAHFAKNDQWAKPELAEAIRKQVEAAGQSMQVCVYDANHAFMNDTRPEVFSPDNATLAWQRTGDFLRKNLA